jgi:hypothetical protein
MTRPLKKHMQWGCMTRCGKSIGSVKMAGRREDATCGICIRNYQQRVVRDLKKGYREMSSFYA